MACKKKRKIKKRDVRAANLNKLAESRHPLDYAIDFHQPYHKRLRRTVGATEIETWNPSPPDQPSLGDRFHALPPELRLEIFAHLLVQPVKWNLKHDPTCDPHRHPQESPRAPTIHAPSWHWTHWPRGLINLNTCIRCMDGHFHQRVPLWNRDEPPLKVWRNPWRSEWAPEVGNEFVCSDCWDAELRVGAHPRPIEMIRGEWMKCLCARRENLQVLLVCRRWYEEGASLFYTANTFAFETTQTFVDFTTNLPPRWRAMISKISIRFYRPDSYLTSQYPEGHVANILASLDPNSALRPLWSALRTLPSLSRLELDALLLTRPIAVQALLRLGLRNLRALSFTLRDRPATGVERWSDDTPWIYPEFLDSRILVGGLAEAVARSAMGERRGWLKRYASIKRSAEREEGVLRGVLLPFVGDESEHGVIWEGERERGKDCAMQVLDGGRGRRIWYDDNVDEWEVIWKMNGGRGGEWDYLPSAAPEGRESDIAQLEKQVLVDDAEEKEVEVIPTEYSEEDLDPLAWLEGFHDLSPEEAVGAPFAIWMARAEAEEDDEYWGRFPPALI